jgi:3-methylfumaryl-CoA hydratase
MTDTQITQTDRMDPARAQAMQATLGQMPTLEAGDALPPFFHQLYFWTPLPPDRLGRDGHPARGEGVIPDLGLPRRMWAGGRLEFLRPIRAGLEATCTTTRLSASHKTGRSGALGLVTLGFEIHQDGALCLREERDLIYREEADPNAPKHTPPSAPETSETRAPLAFTTTQLFRYSALTFNGHRIHYDLDYAKGVEGYDGLVVHGPLLAQYLMLKATHELGPLARFEFRATAPLMDWETAAACRKGKSLWIEGPDGRLCMDATAIPA